MLDRGRGVQIPIWAMTIWAALFFTGSSHMQALVKVHIDRDVSFGDWYPERFVRQDGKSLHPNGHSEQSCVMKNIWIFQAVSDISSWPQSCPSLWSDTVTDEGGAAELEYSNAQNYRDKKHPAHEWHKFSGR